MSGPRKSVDYFTTLPRDLARDKIYPYLSPGDLNSVSRTSRNWNTFFKASFKCELLIMRDFNIPLAALYEFRDRLCGFANDWEGYFEAIYQHLRILFSRVPFVNVHLPYYYRSIPLKLNLRYLLQPQNYQLLLACCANIKNGHAILKSTIPPDEAEAWMWISLLANAENSVEFFLAKTPRCMNLKVTQNNVLDVTAAAGHFDMLKMLMKQAKYSLIHDADSAIKYAAESGNTQMFRYLNRQHSERGSSLDSELILQHAAKSGSCDMVREVLHPRPPSSAYIPQDALDAALASGSIELVNLFLFDDKISKNAKKKRVTRLREIQPSRDTCEMLNYIITNPNTLHLRPYQLTLNWAISLGNVAVTRFLLDHASQYQLQINNEALLRAAARSGNVEMLRLILDTVNNFGIVPNWATLYIAMRANNPDAVYFLLDPAHGFDLFPDKEMLYCSAADEGNLEAVYYLLDPENGYNLAFSSRSDLDHWIDSIPSLLHPLINCSEALDNFFYYLRIRDEPAALNYLQLNFTNLSARHFARIMIHALSHPALYPLDVIGVEPLYGALAQLLKSRLVFIERDQINAMLVRSSEDRLKQMANLSADIPVASEPQLKKRRAY